MVSSRKQGTVGIDVSSQGIADDNFKVCVVLCYLGLPPSLLKTGVELFVRAVAEQYRATYDLAKADKEFRCWKEEFRAYGVVKTIKHILSFAVRGKFSFIPVTKLAPKTKILQEMLYRFLVKRVAKSASLALAEQVLRKVTLVVELGFASACVAKCSAEAYARLLLQLGEYIGQGVVVGLKIVEGLAGVAREVGVAVFVHPLLTARASLDPYNWTLSDQLPDLTRGDIQAVALYVWTKVKDLKPDDFPQFMTTPLSVLKIPANLLQDMALGVERIGVSP